MTLCSRCANIDLEASASYVHSSLGKIKASAERECPGCKFFLDIIEQVNESDNYEQIELLLERQNAKSQVLLILRDETLMVHGYKLLQICSSYGFEPTISAKYHRADDEVGRIVAAHAAEPQCLDLAKEWFHRCTISHGSLCALEEDAMLPTRLIHIPPEQSKPLRLVSTKGMSGLQYVALSYCWGTGSVFKTTQDTLKDRLSGFPSGALPKLLQDVVHFVREFGMQWIWIDAICIVQGDQIDWSQESSSMAGVYGNAAFTICADHAHNMDASLLLPRDLPVSHKFGLDGLGSFCLQHHPNEWKTMCGQALYARGWAFQERILAPRIIHFLDDQIAWECNTTLYQEGFHGSEPNPVYHWAKTWFANYVFQRRLTTKPPTLGLGDDIDLHVRTGRWNLIIQEISVRFFTVNSDTLPAISGLASAIQLPELGRYFAGVWEYNPFLTMFWHVRYSQSTLPVKYKAPSWSWVWTEQQLMWHWFVLIPDLPDLTVDLVEAWRAWNSQWGPRLINQHMILKNKDPKGEVLEGSYILMTGFCREVYIAPRPGTQYDPWPGVGSEELERGHYIYMDRWENDIAFASSFAANLHEEYPEVEASNVRRYLCVQIAQEKRDPPKTLALILEEVEGADAFRRVGLLAFNFDEADSAAWARRELKLV